METRRRKVTVDDIGDPLDFKHVSHVGLNSWEVTQKTVKKTNHSVQQLEQPVSVSPVYSTISKKKIIPPPLQIPSQASSSNVVDNNVLLNKNKNEEITGHLKDEIGQDYERREASQQNVTESEVPASISLSPDSVSSTTKPTRIAPPPPQNSQQLADVGQSKTHIKPKKIKKPALAVIIELPFPNGPLRVAPLPPQSGKIQETLKKTGVCESPVILPGSPLRAAPPPPLNSSLRTISKDETQETVKQTTKVPLQESLVCSPGSSLKAAPLPTISQDITRETGKKLQKKKHLQLHKIVTFTTISQNGTQDTIKQTSEVVLQETHDSSPGSCLKISPLPLQNLSHLTTISQDEAQETATHTVEILQKSLVSSSGSPLKVAPQALENSSHPTIFSQDKNQEIPHVLSQDSLVSFPHGSPLRIAPLPPQNSSHTKTSTEGKYEDTLNKPVVAVLEPHVSLPAKPLRAAPPPPQNSSQQTIKGQIHEASSFPISRRLNIRVHSRQTSSLPALSDVTSLSPDASSSKTTTSSRQSYN
ncbi:hypothetical protein FQR65_LT01114 [Abscondita terminalis]|nr:hypothetical protein FQR65_LT01114 [Abscondita terminalis]